MKREYTAPQMTVHGTIQELTQGVKQLKPPSDGNYLGNIDSPLNGSCHCTPGTRP